MRRLRALKVELVAIAALLTVGGLVALVNGLASAGDPEDYELIVDDDLEPFRSAFNDASAHVRIVLLVGPT